VEGVGEVGGTLAAKSWCRQQRSARSHHLPSVSGFIDEEPVAELRVITMSVAV